MVDFKINKDNEVLLSKEDLQHVDAIIDGIRLEYREIKNKEFSGNAEKSLMLYRDLLGAIKAIEKYTNNINTLLPKSVRWTIIKDFPFFIDLHKLSIQVKQGSSATRNLSHVWVGVYRDKKYIPNEWSYNPIVWVKKNSDTNFVIESISQSAILNTYYKDMGKFKEYTGSEFDIKFNSFEDMCSYL